MPTPASYYKESQVGRMMLLVPGLLHEFITRWRFVICSVTSEATHNLLRSTDALWYTYPWIWFLLCVRRGLITDAVTDRRWQSLYKTQVQSFNNSRKTNSSGTPHTLSMDHYSDLRRVCLVSPPVTRDFPSILKLYPQPFKWPPSDISSRARLVLPVDSMHV